MESISDKIRKAEDGRSETIDVPEWGDIKMEIRSMTGDERAAMLEQFIDPETEQINYAKLYPSLLVATCFDPETGEHIFEPSAVSWLGQKNAGVLERVGSVSARLSGMDKGAEERAGKDS